VAHGAHVALQRHDWRERLLHRAGGGVGGVCRRERGGGRGASPEDCNQAVHHARAVGEREPRDGARRSYPERRERRRAGLALVDERGRQRVDGVVEARVAVGRVRARCAQPRLQCVDGGLRGEVPAVLASEDPEPALDRSRVDGGRGGEQRGADANARAGADSGRSGRHARSPSWCV
jgi:hypothetical protein